MLNRGKIAVDGAPVSFSYGNQSPAVDAVPLAWKVGDRRFYIGGSDPTLVGYECTVAGTPGTWVDITTGGSTPDTFIEQGVQDTRANDWSDEPVAQLGAGSSLTLPPVTGTLIVQGVQDTRSNDEVDEPVPPLPGLALPGQSGLLSGYDKLLLDGSRQFLAAQGLIAQSYDRSARVGSVVTVSGTVYYMAVQLFKGDIVANVSVGVVSVATGATLCKVGLYSKTGVRLGLSTSQHVSWAASTGIKTVPLISAVTITDTDLYYLAVIIVGSTPTMFAHTTAGSSAQCASTAIGTGVSEMGVQTGQTDLPSPGTIATNSTVAISYWLGAS